MMTSPPEQNMIDVINKKLDAIRIKFSIPDYHGYKFRVSHFIKPKDDDRFFVNVSCFYPGKTDAGLLGYITSVFVKKEEAESSSFDFQRHLLNRVQSDVGWMVREIDAERHKNRNTNRINNSGRLEKNI